MVAHGGWKGWEVEEGTRIAAAVSGCEYFEHAAVFVFQHYKSDESSTWLYNTSFYWFTELRKLTMWTWFPVSFERSKYTKVWNHCCTATWPSFLRFPCSETHSLQVGCNSPFSSMAFHSVKMSFCFMGLFSDEEKSLKRKCVVTVLFLGMPVWNTQEPSKL